jgi:hypothetical protein
MPSCQYQFLGSFQEEDPFRGPWIRQIDSAKLEHWVLEGR